LHAQARQIRVESFLPLLEIDGEFGIDGWTSYDNSGGKGCF